MLKGTGKDKQTQRSIQRKITNMNSDNREDIENKSICNCLISVFGIWAVFMIAFSILAVVKDIKVPLLIIIMLLPLSAFFVAFCYIPCKYWKDKRLNILGNRDNINSEGDVELVPIIPEV